MTNQSTTTRRPLELTPGRIVTVCPDPLFTDQHGKPGEWTVTTLPIQFDSYARVDVTDRVGQPATWVLRLDEEVTVEVTDAERQAAAVGVAACLAVEVADGTLPGISEWAAENGEVKARLTHPGWGVDEAAWAAEGMEAWRERLDVDAVQAEVTDYGFTRLYVRAVVDGVPVEVRASFRTPKVDAAPAVKAEVSA